MARRRSSRKTRKSARKGRGLSIISTLYSPLNHFFKATGNSARTVSRGVGNLAGTVVGTVDRVGKTYARETNRAISDLTGSRRRGSRKSRSTRRRN